MNASDDLHCENLLLQIENKTSNRALTLLDTSANQKLIWLVVRLRLAQIIYSWPYAGQLLR
jgi:hypothetical protein